MKGVGHNTWPTSPVGQTLQLRSAHPKTLNAGLADPAIKARLAETGTIPMISLPRISAPMSPPKPRNGPRW